jgi:hypothetical protein
MIFTVPLQTGKRCHVEQNNRQPDAAAAQSETGAGINET